MWREKVHICDSYVMCIQEPLLRRRCNYGPYQQLRTTEDIDSVHFLRH